MIDTRSAPFGPPRHPVLIRRKKRQEIAHAIAARLFPNPRGEEWKERDAAYIAADEALRVMERVIAGKPFWEPF